MTNLNSYHRLIELRDHVSAWCAGHRGPLLSVPAEVVRLLALGGGEASRVFGRRPALKVAGVRVEERLDLNDSSLNSPFEIVDCVLEGGLSLRDSSIQRLSISGSMLGSPDLETHALDLRDARVGQRIEIQDSSLIADTASAVDCTSSFIGGSVLIAGAANRSNVTAKSRNDSNGAVVFVFAQIDGSLDIRSSTVVNECGPAVNVSGARIHGNTSIRPGTEILGSSRTGSLQIIGTSVAGSLSLGDLKATNLDGPAVNLRGVQVGNNFYMDSGFMATGSGRRGSLRMARAHIGGSVRILSSTVQNTSDIGPAMDCEGLRVDGGFALASGGEGRSHFSSLGEGGGLRLSGAVVQGYCTVAESTFETPAGPALVASDARLESGLLLSDLQVEASADLGSINLARTAIEGMLTIDRRLADQAADSQPWTIDGLTYVDYPDIVEPNRIGRMGATFQPVVRRGSSRSDSFAAWLRLIRHGTTEYAAQPYQQLAAVARSDGYEVDARRSLKEQRRAREDSGTLGRPGTLASRMSGYTVGYGYDSWRPLFGLALNLLASFILVSTAFAAQLTPAGDGTSPPIVNNEECEIAGRLLVAIEISVPLIDLASSNGCSVARNASLPFTIVNLLHQITGWAAASLFVAGFSGLIRRV